MTIQSELTYTMGINERQRALLEAATRFMHNARTTLTDDQREELDALHDMLRDLPDEEHDDPGVTHMFYL